MLSGAGSADLEKFEAKGHTVEHANRSASVDDDSPFPNVYDGLLSNDLPRIPSVAAQAAKDERRLTFRSALSLYGRAIGWAAAISFAIIMEGFGTGLLNNFYAFPAFQKQYGIKVSDTDYEIPTHWQITLNNSGAGCSIIGILANGMFVTRFGYRITMLGSLTFLALSNFAAFFGYSLHILLASIILTSLSWGVFSMLTTTYASEVLPLNLRGYMIASVNMCWLIGQIIAGGTLRGFIGMKSEWSYRIPFSLQWVFIVIVAVIAIMAPDSPWWLVQRDRLADARNVLLRLTKKSANFDPEPTLAAMCHTNEVEKKMSNGRNSSYLECFKGTNLRRTEIACMAFAIQNASGLPVISFAAYFYSKIGFSQKQSFDITVGMQGVAILGNFLAYFLMNRVGRRKLYLIGLSAQLTILLAAGIVSVFAETTRTLWAMAGLIILFIFVFDLTVGPMTYVLVAEIPSSRMRVKTVALARTAYNLCALVTNVLQTNMLNTLSWGWRGKSCFFWAGVCALSLVYVWFRVPETAGLTYLELDLLFEKRAGARKFEGVRRRLEETGYFSADDGAGGGGQQWVERASIAMPGIGGIG